MILRMIQTLQIGRVTFIRIRMRQENYAALTSLVRFRHKNRVSQAQKHNVSGMKTLCSCH